MRIKILNKVIVAGHNVPLPKGTVVESKNGDQEDEFKALCAVGYAKTTNEPVSDIAHVLFKPGANTPPVSGIHPAKQTATSDNDESGDDADLAAILETATSDNDESGDDADLAAILEGSVSDVTEALSALDAKQLARIAKLEAAGKDRKGVAEAIAAAQAEG